MTSRRSPPSNPLDGRDRRRSSISTAPARRARPGTSRSPPSGGLLLSAGRCHRRAAGERSGTRAAACSTRSGSARDAGWRAEAARALDVTTLSRALVEAYAKLTGRSDVTELADRRRFAEFAEDRQLIDLFESYPEKLDARTADSACCVRCRAGSIRSPRASRRIPAKRISLVGAVRWESHGRKRGGVASTYFADRRKRRRTVRIYVKPNRHFRLPEDGDRPIIMIGAGTGVAPYRAFIEERAETGAKGKSWLFFGERNYTTTSSTSSNGRSTWQRRSVAHRRRVLARPAGEDLRAAAAVGAPRRAARMDRGRRAHLRLRRREGHGAATWT